jgi:predicted nuclease of predicted toxin-antitoxin system
MKFIADENISPKVVSSLKKAGVDIVSIKEYGSG